MKMFKNQKVEYVNKMSEEIKKYSVVGILPLETVPDRLFQKLRNNSKKDMKMVIARKRLMLKILQSDPKLKDLEKYVKGNVALLLSNKDPFELNDSIVKNRIKMGAKPNQISPDDLGIDAGETSIAPGQAVTDLKAAGIDVKIDKGKVVISKSKVLVKKGAKITGAVAKALKMLDITPFETGTKVAAMYAQNMIYTNEVLSITPELLSTQIASAFRAADVISTDIGMVTQYNVDKLIKKAYIAAMGVGLSAKVYEPEIVEKLLAQAVASALSISVSVPDELKAEQEEQKKE